MNEAGKPNESRNSTNHPAETLPASLGVGSAMDGSRKKKMIIKSDFLESYRLRQLTNMLGGDSEAPLYVIRLWAICERQKTWELTTGDDELEIDLEYQGPDGLLIESLSDCGYITATDKKITVLDFPELNKAMIRHWQKWGG